MGNVWLEIPAHFENIDLDQYIIMPNHIHGIIIINSVGNGHARSVNKNAKNNNLSVVIGSFKSAVSKRINQLNNIPFKWQRSFYDHIIRIDESLNNIREYIANNPSQWDNDENNIKNSIGTRHALSLQDKYIGISKTSNIYMTPIVKR